jgi:hypothetical protein
MSTVRQSACRQKTLGLVVAACVALAGCHRNTPTAPSSIPPTLTGLSVTSAEAGSVLVDGASFATLPHQALVN